MVMGKSTLDTQLHQEDPFNPLARAEKALTEQDSPQNKVLYAEVAAARQIWAPVTLTLWLLQINWLGFEVLLALVNLCVKFYSYRRVED